MNIKIIGTGSAVPKLRVTNDDLSKMMDTSDEWIKSRTGIEARHIAVEEPLQALLWKHPKRHCRWQESRQKKWI